MAALTVNRPSAAGSALTYVAADVAGDTFTNTGREFLHVVNDGGSPITVTISCPNACSFNVVDTAHDVAVTVAAGVNRMIGPFDKNKFNDDDDLVSVAYSDVTSVTVAAISNV